MTLEEANAAFGQAGDGLVCLFDAQVRTARLVESLSMCSTHGAGETRLSVPRRASWTAMAGLGGRTMVALDGAWYPVGAGIDADDPGVRSRPVDGSSRLLVLEQDAFLRIGGLRRGVHDVFRSCDGSLLQTCRNRWKRLVRAVVADLGPASSVLVTRNRSRRSGPPWRGAPLRSSTPIVEDLDRFPHRAVAVRDGSLSTVSS